VTPANNSRPNLRKIYLVAVLFILLVLILFPSCRPEPLSPQEAIVIIMSPLAETTLSTNAVTIKTFVENFTLIDKVGQNNSPGEGHLIYYLDVTPPLKQGEPSLTGEGSYVISTELTLTWQNVPAGQHIFWAQLVNNDNTPLQPPSAVRVPVTLK
jgi:hypothetical protein